MIHLYGVGFRNFSYVRKSLESLLNNASEPIILTVVDNPDNLPNSGTIQIRAYLTEQVNKGRIKRALFMNQNTIGWGLVQAIKDFPPDDSEPFFCMTDLDLVVDDGCDWIKQIRQVREIKQAVYTGCTLYMRNFVPPNQGYRGDEDDFGLWLVSADTKLYSRYVGFDTNTIDGHLIKIFKDLGHVEKILDIRLYHMAWDNHLYDLEYANYKRSLKEDWAFQSKPADMSYKLITR